MELQITDIGMQFTADIIIVLFHITIIVIFADVLLCIITMQDLFHRAIMAHGIIYQGIIIDILLV